MDQPREALAAFIERAVNAWLDTDPHSARRLSELDGIVIGLEITTLPLELFFMPAAGRIRVRRDSAREPDTWIRGGLFDVAGLASLAGLGLGEQRVGGGARLTIEGDIAAGQAFQHILKAGDFDWEELLSRRVGDVAAHELAQGVRATGRWARRSLDSVNTAVGDYLREEAQLVPGDREVRDFIRRVDALRDSVEHLEARARRPARGGGS